MTEPFSQHKLAPAMRLGNIDRTVRSFRAGSCDVRTTLFRRERCCRWCGDVQGLMGSQARLDGSGEVLSRTGGVGLNPVCFRVLPITSARIPPPPNAAG
ncbi:hypothetical protein METY_0299 [Methylopila sp. Yamaguchi]|nr:hypothetical protein METY_0299 [Methylopila sp. Yamaguchi]